MLYKIYNPIGRFVLTCTSTFTQLVRQDMRHSERSQGKVKDCRYLYWRLCWGGGGGAEPSTSSLAAAALSQLLAIRTGVNHLMCVLAHPDCRPIGVSLLGLKRAMHLGTVAAALTRGRHEGGEKEIKDKQKRWCEGGGAVFELKTEGKMRAWSHEWGWW